MLLGGQAMCACDRELTERLERDGHRMAADRIRELKRALARAEQRIGLFLAHAAKRKARKQ